MDKQTTLIAAWFGSAVSTLLFAFIFLIYLSTPKIVHPSTQNLKIFAALPQSGISVSEIIDAGDARAKIIENFFIDYKSPLAKYSNDFVSVADKYRLDWRLLPSIAMQESNGGKKVIKNSHNPFGYGIYGKLVKKFEGWEQAIESVGKTLREDYLNQGLKTPVQIMTKYTPSSLAKGGAWAKGVSTFMEELR